MAVVTLPEFYRPAGAVQWPDGLARSFRAVAPLLQKPSFRCAVWLALLGAALGGLAGTRSEVGAPEPPASAPAPTQPLQWIDIVRPSPLFTLASPDFSQAPSAYAARADVEGGGRRDILTFGTFDGGATPYLHLSLYRNGSEAAPSATFFVDLARRAGEVELAVTRSGQPASLSTRFGDFEVADVVLAHGTAQTACLGFRFHRESPDFDVAGFACGGAGEPFSRTRLACTLDRLDLVSADADQGLGQFFTAARSDHKNACESGPGPASPTPQRSPRKAKQNPKSTDRAKKVSR